MLAPDSLGLLVVLAGLAAGALWLAFRYSHRAVRVAACAVALTLAFIAGIGEVNRYYGYYRTWGDLVTGMTGGPSVGSDLDAATTTVTPASTHTRTEGRLVALTLAGQVSHVSRKGYVWLPPGYATLQAAGTQLPVLMLIHGSPGEAADWITALHVDQVLDDEYDDHRIGPMVVVLVPANPVRKAHEECVDATHGVQDETYVAQDIPADIEEKLDVLPTGASWAIGGFSSGGYCAANLALHRPADFGAVIDLDGYLHPWESGNESELFQGNRAAEQTNDVVWSLRHRFPSPLPAFFLASSSDGADQTDAKTLDKLLAPHESVPFVVEHGSKHTFYVWAAALPGSLDWVWHQVAPPALQRQFPTLDPTAPGRADVSVGAPPAKRRPPGGEVTLARGRTRVVPAVRSAPTPHSSGATASHP